MKKEIHPKYDKSKVVCACGNTWETLSTKPEIHVELCSSCHPYYTGKQKLVDTEGRVDKFEARRKKAEELMKGKNKGPAKPKEKVAPEKEEEEIKELDKEMMEIEEEFEGETVDIAPETKNAPAKEESDKDKSEERVEAETAEIPTEKVVGEGTKEETASPEETKEPKEEEK